MIPARKLVMIAFVAAAVTGAGTGCKVGATPKTGAGESTDICSAYRQYNALRPPVTSDVTDVKAYVTSAERVLHRIDRKMSYHNLSGHRSHVPPTVLQQVGDVKQAYAALQVEVRSINDKPQLAEVVQRFSGSASFESADTAVELWIRSNCA